MTDTEILNKVKDGLLITGNYQDEALKIYIDEVRQYLSSAGVKDEILESSVSVGIIVRGVLDLWNNESGSTKFSQYFMQRAIQLASIKETEGVSG